MSPPGVDVVLVDRSGRAIGSSFRPDSPFAPDSGAPADRDALAALGAVLHRESPEWAQMVDAMARRAHWSGWLPVAPGRESPTLVFASVAPFAEAGPADPVIALTVFEVETQHGDNSSVASEIRYRNLAEQLPIGLMCCRDGGITYLNQMALRMLGVASLGEVQSRGFLEFIHPEFRAMAETRGAPLRVGGQPDQTMVRQRFLRPDGTTLDVEVITLPFEDMLGRGTYSWAVDVTEKVIAERALQGSEQRWRSLVENASDIIAVLNDDGTLRSFTPAAARILGFTDDDTGDLAVADFVHPDDLPAVIAAISDVLAEPGAQARTEFRVARPDGSWCWLESISTNRMDDPAIEGVICNVRDVSDRRAAEDALRHQATHDALTGLPNRVALTDGIAAGLADGRPEGAVLLLDLDGFKDINDGLGHDVGDQVLADVGRRLLERTRPGDLVSRLGGDEFAIWVTGREGKRNATAIAANLLAALNEPFELEGTSLTIGASIGIAFAPDHGTTPSALLQAADVAMYRAKEEGMSWAVHSNGDLQVRRHRLTVVSQLRRALDTDALEVHYQPQIELATGIALGVEALVRWGPVLGGPHTPDEFIPLAERTGLIGPLTEYVLGKALRQCRDWRSEGIELTVAVNMSTVSLRDPNLVSTVVRALADAGLPASCLTLEITETGLADPNPAAIRILGELRRRGIRLSVDDLGIGYSSLSYLKRLPISEVKIDKSFLLGLADERDRAIVRSLIDLGHSLGLTVVAEGVESEATHASLIEAGCDMAQGFLFCRPRPAAMITEWMLEQGAAGPPFRAWEMLGDTSA